MLLNGSGYCSSNFGILSRVWGRRPWNHSSISSCEKDYTALKLPHWLWCQMKCGGGAYSAICVPVNVRGGVKRP